MCHSNSLHENRFLMSYAPGVPYKGADYLYDAIGSLGEDFAKAVEKKKQDEQIAALNDSIINVAQKNGDIGQAEIDKYNQMSQTQKNAYAHTLGADIHDRWQKTLQQSEIGLRNQQV